MASLSLKNVCKQYPNGFEAVKDFCKIMCENPRLPKTPVYGSNNWYYAYGESSEEEILADTDYVVSITEGAENRPFMVIDDCWQELRKPEYIGGPWKKGNAKFPDMKALADKLKAKGVRTGIWMRYLLNVDEEIKDEIYEEDDRIFEVEADDGTVERLYHIATIEYRKDMYCVFQKAPRCPRHRRQ